jgi:hypothetical protein
MVNSKERKDSKPEKAEKIISNAIHIALLYDQRIVDESELVQSLLEGKEWRKSLAIMVLKKDLASLF